MTYTFDKSKCNVCRIYSSRQIVSRGMKRSLAAVPRRKYDVICTSERGDGMGLAGIHKSTWDRKTRKRALLRPKHFRRRAVSLTDPIKKTSTLPPPPRENRAGNTRRTFPFGRLVRHNLQIYASRLYADELSTVNHVLSLARHHLGISRPRRVSGSCRGTSRFLFRLHVQPPYLL